MNILYFDCFSGVSGDMILGALVDAGLDIADLSKELDKLKLDGYDITAEKKTVKGIAGTKVNVNAGHQHHHRGLSDIFKIIDDSELNGKVKETSKAIFQRLGEAEAKIHNKATDEIDFHEVGAVDSIVDIVGAAIGMELMGIDKVYASKLHVGTGTVDCAHGTLPLPAPATMELLKGVPVYSTGIEKELVTPTGAAVVTTLSDGYGGLPAMQIEKTGFGFGSHELDRPNFLRVAIGQAQDSSNTDTTVLIETNIDDMNPQYYDHIMDVLFTAGARDVFLTPIIMKKNRPGIILSVLTTDDKIETLTDIIFNETTTLGVRISNLQKRRLLSREIKSVETSLGTVRVKIRTIHDSRKVIAPEYDDCKVLAKKLNKPIQQISEIIKKEAESILFPPPVS
jgi:uncharacterized protein (TIGR00299 family) protein